MKVRIARQPVFDVSGNVFSYRICYNYEKENPTDVLSVGQNDKNRLFGCDVLMLVGKNRALIHFTDEMLAARLPLSFSTDILIVGVSAEQLKDAEIMDFCRELKQQGYMIALENFEYGEDCDELLRLADIIGIDFKKSNKIIEKTAFFCHSSDKPMLAANVDTNKELEYAKKLGFTLMHGCFFAMSETTGENDIPPVPAKIIQVMQMLSKDDTEIEDVVDAISVDPSFCKRLLKLINSVYFGFTVKIASINQAVVVLGLDYIREWVYLMAVQKLTGNYNPEAMKMSLLMAKVCRSVALLSAETAKNCESYYLMGLLSMLVLAGDSVLEQALRSLPLTNEIKTGLLRRGGTYSDAFEMVYEYVCADWDSFEELAVNSGIDPQKFTEIYIACANEVEQTRMN